MWSDVVTAALRGFRWVGVDSTATGVGFLFLLHLHWSKLGSCFFCGERLINYFYPLTKGPALGKAGRPAVCMCQVMFSPLSWEEELSLWPQSGMAVFCVPGGPLGAVVFWWRMVAERGQGEALFIAFWSVSKSSAYPALDNHLRGLEQFFKLTFVCLLSFYFKKKYWRMFLYILLSSVK